MPESDPILIEENKENASISGSKEEEEPVKEQEEIIEKEEIPDSQITTKNIQATPQMIRSVSTIDPNVGQIEIIPPPKPIIVSQNFSHEQIIEQVEDSNNVERVIQHTEELLSMYSAELAANPQSNLHKELSKRIYNNMKLVIDIMSLPDKTRKISEKSLARAAEIGKNYLEGPIQAKLLSVVLEEYRRCQEGKIIELEEEKQNIESTQKLSAHYGIMQTLLNVFPEDLLKELENLKKKISETEVQEVTEKESNISGESNDTETKNAKKTINKGIQKKANPQASSMKVLKPVSKLQKSRRMQPKVVQKQPLAQKQTIKSSAWNVKKPKVNPNKKEMHIRNGSKTMKTADAKAKKVAQTSANDQSWFGMQSSELVNDELWEKDSI